MLLRYGSEMGKSTVIQAKNKTVKARSTQDVPADDAELAAITRGDRAFIVRLVVAVVIGLIVAGALGWFLTGEAVGKSVSDGFEMITQ